MNYNEIMKELAQYMRMADEIAATVESLKDALKKYMNENNLDSLIGDEHKALYKTVTSTRIDTAAIKQIAPDIAKRCSKTVTTKRFTFS